jgi:hypothetical protein
LERRNLVATVAAARDPTRREEIDAVIAKAKPPRRMGQLLVFGAICLAWGLFLLIIGVIAATKGAASNARLLPVAAAVPYMGAGLTLLLVRAKRLQSAAHAEREVELTEERVTIGVIAAFLSAGLTAVAIVYGSLGFNQGMLIDVAIVVALAIGVMRKSRTCAALLIVYFVLSRYAAWRVTQNIQLTINWQSFLIFGSYALGLQGTISYHRFQQRRTGPAATSPSATGVS